MANSRARHLAKSATWRVIGTLDTMVLAWIISGNPLTGIKIGAAEVVTKMVLYYFHERAWYKVNFVFRQACLEGLVLFPTYGNHSIGNF